MLIIFIVIPVHDDINSSISEEGKSSNYELLIRILQSFLHRSINVIIDLSYNRNFMGSQVVYFKIKMREQSYINNLIS